MDELDKHIIAMVQNDLPLCSRPFASLAENLGLKEEEVAARLRQLKEQKIMRRFGATLRHQQSGFPANVMSAWQAPLDRIEDIGRHFSRSRRITHCYQRVEHPDFPYNLFAMVHGASEDECRQIVRELADSVNLHSYILLFSRQELKKTSMRYF